MKITNKVFIQDYQNDKGHIVTMEYEKEKEHESIVEFLNTGITFPLISYDDGTANYFVIRDGELEEKQGTIVL